MITAIINELKTGSIPDVIPFGQNVANPNKPYVVVGEDDPTQQAGTENGVNNYTVNAHFPKGHVDQIRDYILDETKTLLDGKILTTRDGRKMKIEATSRIGKIITGNDDGTISKSREFVTPGIWE